MSITVKAHVNKAQSMVDTMLAGIPKSNIIFTQEQVATEPEQVVIEQPKQHTLSNEEIDARVEATLAQHFPNMAGMAKFLSRS